MDISITVEQGNNLFRAAYLWKFPKKVGEKSFSEGTVSTFNDYIRQFVKACKKVSPIWREEKRLYFGPREAWERLETVLTQRQREELPIGSIPDDVQYKNKAKDMEVPITLTGEARQGLFWICYLMLHPSSDGMLAAGQQDDLVWPVVERLGNKAVATMQEHIGLTKKETVESLKLDEDSPPPSAK